MCHNVTCASASHKTAACPPECSPCWCGRQESSKRRVDKHGGFLQCRLDPPPTSASPAAAQGKPCNILCLDQQGIGVAFSVEGFPSVIVTPFATSISPRFPPSAAHQSFQGWETAAMPVVVGAVHLPRLRPSLRPLEGFATDAIAVLGSTVHMQGANPFLPKEWSLSPLPPRSHHGIVRMCLGSPHPVRSFFFSLR